MAFSCHISENSAALCTYSSLELVPILWNNLQLQTLSCVNVTKPQVPFGLIVEGEIVKCRLLWVIAALNYWPSNATLLYSCVPVGIGTHSSPVSRTMTICILVLSPIHVLCSRCSSLLSTDNKCLTSYSSKTSLMTLVLMNLKKLIDDRLLWYIYLAMRIHELSTRSLDI